VNIESVTRRSKAEEEEEEEVVPLSEHQRRSSCRSGWPGRASHTGRPGTRLSSAPGGGWWCARCWLVTEKKLNVTFWIGWHKDSFSLPGSFPTDSYVGSLARLRNRQTLSMEPFSSKSDLKKRAVSMLTWKVAEAPGSVIWTRFEQIVRHKPFTDMKCVTGLQASVTVKAFKPIKRRCISLVGVQLWNNVKNGCKNGLLRIISKTIFEG